MIEFPLIFVTGLMGSSHCLGMCGPFALLLGATTQKRWTAAMKRQLLYSLGRIFTYAILGTVAGYAGLRLSSFTRFAVNVPAILAILAGCFLVYQGLVTAGIFRRSSVGNSPCLAAGILGHFLKSSSMLDVFLAGVLTGFLPCGLVYGLLGVAAATKSVILGMSTMIAFGAGTLPVMVGAGMGGKFLSIAVRKRLLHVAAWCLVLTGMLSIVRGVHFFGFDHGDVAAVCPLCE